MSSQDPNIGRDLLGGQFQILQKIGSGGMGSVYKAAQPEMNRMVAVKILHKKLVNRKDLMSRFRREARAMSHLTHPNTVKVLLYGELDDGSLYIVMEYLEGRNLNQVVRKEGPMSVDRAIPILIQVCGALQEAHLQGIVHRDLKPENILVSDDAAGRGRVRVLDFGLAKLVGSEGGEAQTMTQPGMVMGTLGYMAPEQLQGEETDERTDLFSIGVMAAEALTGRRPFAGRTLFELLRSIEREDFRLPGETAETRRLEEVLRRCLARQRQRRPASAEELRRDLIDALRACAPDALYEEEPLDADTFILPNAPPPASV